jgi:hypothetical protein
VLTALRRVQGKSDPLTILVEGKSHLECRLGYLPPIAANLTNLDPEKAVVQFEKGGDYRAASRANKWRVQVTDAQGHVLPEIDDPDMGGFMREETLAYGESMPALLQLGAYVAIDKPGTYAVTVMYHPRIRIACLTRVDGLICAHSLPITLDVRPIEIESTDAEQAGLAALALQLPKTNPVNILAGAADKEAVDAFFSKGSPAAQLKLAGWQAVPTLIAAVNGDKLTPIQRAWALGLLFGITNQNNPIDTPGAIGPFHYRHTGWISLGGVESGRSVSQRSMDVFEGEIKPEAQTGLAKRWNKWIENGYIKVNRRGG